MVTRSKFRQQTKMATDITTALWAIPPTTKAAASDLTGGTIDILKTGALSTAGSAGNGAQTGKLNISWGASSANTLAVKVEHDTDPAFGTTATLYALETALAATTAGAKTYEMDLSQAKRYVRVVITPAASTSVVLAADLILGDLDNDSYPDVTTISGT